MKVKDSYMKVDILKCYKFVKTSISPHLVCIRSQYILVHYTAMGVYIFPYIFRYINICIVLNIHIHTHLRYLLNDS